MKRFEDWPERLHAEIERARERPFAYGEWDCCIWTASVVEALTGEDFLPDFPRYTSKDEALDIIAGHGGLAGIASVCLGDPVPLSLAQRGDVVMWSGSLSGPALGIVVDHRAAFAAPMGLLFVPLLKCDMAWGV